MNTTRIAFFELVSVVLLFIKYLFIDLSNEYFKGEEIGELSFVVLAQIVGKLGLFNGVWIDNPNQTWALRLIFYSFGNSILLAALFFFLPQG